MVRGWAEGGVPRGETHLFGWRIRCKPHMFSARTAFSTAMQIFRPTRQHLAGRSYNVAEGGYLNVRATPPNAAASEQRAWLPTQYQP